MKIAIITDQHFGARKNSKLFHDYFLKFYNDVFFPFLEKSGYNEVFDDSNKIDGDKYSDYNSIKDAVHAKLRN